MSAIPMTTHKTVEFTPPSLAHVEPKPVFFLKVPTWEDRDMIGLRMFRMNVREVTPVQLQATLLNAMFDIFPEDEADESARFLEGFWQRMQQYQLEYAVWQEQEAERIIDNREAAMEFPALPQPEMPTTVRERARASLLTTQIQDNSQAVRDKLADQQGYQKRYNTLIVRLQVAGWDNLDVKMLYAGDSTISPETIEALRTKMHELEPSGGSWDELVREIESFWDLTRSAEKNSSSPQESGSPPSGSRKTSIASDLQETDGSSRSTETTGQAAPSSIEPTRATGSRKTAGTSSRSSKGSGTGTKKRGQTAGR